MKTINVTFTDKEHEELNDAKYDLGFSSWHDFILAINKEVKI